MSRGHIRTLTEKILSGSAYRLTEIEALSLTTAEGDDFMDLLWGADRIRRHYKGDRIFTCAIINAKSGRCSQDCAFCAQSAHYDTGVATYGLMDQQSIVERALEMEDAQITHYSFVTSGFALSDAEIDTICEAAGQIRARTNLTLCCSPGVLSAAQAARVYQSGIRNYHHNLETARSHFGKICTTHEYDDDIRAIETAAGAGLAVCSGGILGLGETRSQRVELAMTLRDLGVEKIPVNFLNPIGGTKMADRPLLPTAEALRAIALFRFACPTEDITICGGRRVTLGDFQSWIFAAGANGVMTGNYLTTPGRDIAADLEMIRIWQSFCKDEQV